MKKRIQESGFSWILATVIIGLFTAPFRGTANPKIRTAFFDYYTNISSSDIVYTIPGVNKTPHCGICHYDVEGGGPPWNPYGQDVKDNLDKDRTVTFDTIKGWDSDGDGYSNIQEITNSSINPNQPTFPGLSADNISSVINVTPSAIIDYVTPTTGGPDTTDPEVDVQSPNGGESVFGNAATVISWNATDNEGVGSINIFVSLDNGGTFTPIARNLPNSPSSYTWFVPNRPSGDCLIMVQAVDTSLNTTNDTSDAVFTINSTNAFPSTLRDFDQPGSQPIVDSGSPQINPSSCINCHGDYSEEHEPYRNWLGSMMAHASHDPIFKANMVIAQQDVPDSGDLCLRCHNSRGWLDGRSTPTDGSQMTPDDMFGVSCDLCHRLVDPHYEAGISPIEDATVLTNLVDVPSSENGNGMYVFDPNPQRRGPFDDAASPHTVLHSPFHQEAALCGTCHNVSNPAFERDGSNAEYVTNTFDQAATDFSPEVLAPVERTYSEWLHSDYNTTNGIYAPQFAGFKADGRVASCQDCHMRDILGHGADTNLYPVAERPDMPLHDMTGGSSWLLKVLPTVTNFPHASGTPEAAAMTNGAERADYMLRKAARMAAEQVGTNLNVMVVNDTGHKLPSGYPEGRRIWINIRFYDAGENLLQEYGGYDYGTGLLTNNTTVYEIHPGIGTNLASILPGIDPGPSFHFVLNNQVYEDNRIPPRGFTNSEFDAFGGAPAGHHYDDGQYWDNTLYPIPEGAVSAHACLFYQSTSKEFMEFLRDENTTDNTGTNTYNLWLANDKCPPVLMTEAFWPESFNIESIGPVDGNMMGISFSSISGYTYWVEFTDTLGSNTVWKPFASNGWFEVYGSPSIVTDDYSSATSGGAPTNGHRFYRIRR